MDGLPGTPTVLADLSRLQKELEQLHQAARSRSADGPKDTERGHESGLVIRGK